MPHTDPRLGRVLVTGGASGLGAAVVEAVAARDPRAVAATVVDALARPPGATIRELVVTAEGEPSWP